MPDKPQLTLYEELMLLALRDEKGTIAADGTAFIYTLGAALISELILSKHITIDEVRKTKKMVDLRRSTRTKDPILDECIERLKTARRRGSIQTWVTRFAGLKKLKHRIALQLSKKGILRVDEQKILLIFSRKVYPEINPRPEKELVRRLRSAIFGKGRDVDPRTSILIALADKAGVLKNVFERKELKLKKARIKEISAGDLTAKAAQDVIDGVNAAIMVAVMIPAMTAATSSAH